MNFDVDKLPDGWNMRGICSGDGPRFVPGGIPMEDGPDDAVLDAACPERFGPCDYVPEGCSYPRD